MQKDELTLDELAQATGMTARNVRAYQTKGLIPAPLRSGRRSVYGLGHLHRLQAIERARARGASLSLIATHLAAGLPLDADTLVGWADRDVRDVTDLVKASGVGADGADRDRLEALTAAGVLLTDGDRVLAGPELADSLGALHRQGFPVQAALGVAQRTAEAVAPVATALQDAVSAMDAATAAATEAAQEQLRELACHVLRRLLTAAPSGEGAGS